MGLRGPAKEPTILKRLKGNPGKYPLPKNEPQPSPGVPRCPEWLREDAKAKWAENAPLLQACGLLTSIDGDALAAYCQAWARWKEAEEFIRANGSVFVLKNDDGSVKFLQQVPQVAIARSLMEILQRYQREFGMTPSARTGIAVDKSTDTPEDDGLILDSIPEGWRIGRSSKKSSDAKKTAKRSPVKKAQ